MASLSKKTIGITVAVAVVLGAAIAAYALNGSGAPAAQTETQKNYAVYKDDRSMGRKDAPVVVIEYLAPTCPICAHFNNTMFPTLKKEYIDTGKILYIARVLPLNSVDAAVEIVARCQPQDKYFPYLDYLYHHQKEWDPEYRVPDVGKALHKLSDEFGIVPEAFDRCLTQHNISQQINDRAQDGQMRYNITGVPTFVVNGKVVEGHSKWENIKAAIDKALAK